MLFHVTAEHDHMTCPAREEGRDSDKVKQALKWIEGNEDVTVLGVYGHQPSHISWVILEADDFNAVTNLLQDQMLMGKVEVMPVNDQIAQRKARGWWGT